MDDGDIRFYFPRAKIMQYSAFKKYNSIEQLLPKKPDSVFVLYEDSPKDGHWTCLTRDTANNINYFDSYGGVPDKPLSWTALQERHSTGRGRVVDVSLFETASCWVSLLASQFLASGQLAGKQGSGAPGIVPYKAYVTLDGEIVIAAGSDGLFKSLSTALGCPQWKEDPRFIDNPARVAHQQELYAMIDAIILTKNTSEWIDCLESAGVPCSPVNNLKQMVEHPQTQALGLVQDVPGTDMRFIGLPLSFDGQRSHPISAPPKLGEHTKHYIKKETE